MVREKKTDLMGDFLKKYFPNIISPDILCLAKIAVAGIMLGFIYYHSAHLVAFMFFFWLIAEFIDIVDGPLARVRHKVTWYGSILDAFTDRLVLLVFFFGIWTALPLLSAFWWGSWLTFILLVSDIGRWLYLWKSGKTSEKIIFWENWGELIEVGFRTVIAAYALLQYILYY